MRVLGGLFLILGLVLQVLGLFMPAGAPYADTANLDALNQRTNVIIFGAAWFVGGCALLSSPPPVKRERDHDK